MYEIRLYAPLYLSVKPGGFDESGKILLKLTLVIVASIVHLEEGVGHAG
jgi:hypothetical protein